MHLLKRSFLVVAIIMTGLSGRSLNELTSVSYADHSTHTTPALELGSITLSFAEKPFIVAHSIVQTNRKGYIELFCPSSVVAKETIQQNISFSERVPCSLKIECIKEPLEGIKLVINYDPEKVHVSYDEFIDSGSSVGFVVRLYDQKILAKLHNYMVPMLRVA